MRGRVTCTAVMCPMVALLICSRLLLLLPKIEPTVCKRILASISSTAATVARQPVRLRLRACWDPDRPCGVTLPSGTSEVTHLASAPWRTSTLQAAAALGCGASVDQRVQFES